MTTPNRRVRVGGLREPVEILVDRYGIAHLYANNDTDVFVAQGFNAARDRLWQIDLWRKRGLGLLAGDFGPAFVERDRAARLLLYRGDMGAEWSAYGAEAKLWTEHFVAGINAYVDWVTQHPEQLPVEFTATGTRPQRWRPEDVVRCRAHARVRNLETEIARLNVAAGGGVDTAALVKGLEPPWELELTEGTPLEPVPDEVLATYRLATTLVDLTDAHVDEALAAEAVLDGSNNWALRPKRTETGRALLATDPHRLQELPSLRYTVHLSAPGLDVIGSGEPAVPGISLGHNRTIAFGLTIFPTDQEDLYVYELDPRDPTRYRYRDGWESMRVVRETVPVRGEAEREVNLAFTRHGPVLHVDEARHRAYALRTVWSEPGTAAYLASLRYQRATSWEEFVAALESWGAPSVNQVYADVEGNVGWITAGAVPVRPGWDGLMPVPGDGRYEWQGFMPSRLHPRELNPSRGWVASANHMNLPASFDQARHKVGFEFAPPGRYDRIQEVLESRPRHSLADMAGLQADVYCRIAGTLVALAQRAAPRARAAKLAIRILAEWDLVLAIDSGAGALFEIWFRRHLIPAVLDRVGGRVLREQIAIPDTDLIVRLLVTADRRLGSDPEDSRDALLAETLAAAWHDARSLLGEDPDAWAWGKIHLAELSHPLARRIGPEASPRWNVGPLPKCGSALTVNNNGYQPTDFRIHHGVSWRMIADVGNWDASLVINSPGQSGDPRSTHYDDHFARWANEEYVPLLYSRAAVEDALEERIVLEPA